MRPALPRRFLIMCCYTLILAVVFYLSTLEPVMAFEGVELTQPDLVVLLLVLAIGARALITGSRFHRLPREFGIALVLFFLSTLLSALFAEDRVRAFAGVVQVAEFSLLASCISLVSSHKDALRIVHFLLAVLVFESLVAVWQLANGLPQPSGTFFINQMYGPFMGFGAATAFGLLTAHHERVKRLTYFAVMCVLGIGSVVGEKRAAWLSFFLAGLAVAFLARHQRKRLLLYFAMGLLAITAVVATTGDIKERTLARLEEFAAYDEQGNTLRTRFELWAVSLQLFLDNPILGVGPKNFLSLVPHFLSVEEMSGSESLDPHNVWVGILAEQGILGFLTYVYMCWAIVYLGIRGFRSGRSDTERSLFLAYIAYNVFWFSMSHNYFTKGEGHLHFLMSGLIAGIVYGGSRVGSKARLVMISPSQTLAKASST